MWGDGGGFAEPNADRGAGIGGGLIERGDVHGGDADGIALGFQFGGYQHVGAGGEDLAGAIEDFAEAGDLDRSGGIGNADPGHAAAGAGDAFLGCNDGAGELDAAGAGGGAGVDLDRRDDAEAAKGLGVRVERVGGEVEADGIGFGGEALEWRPVGHVGQAERFGFAGDAAEQSDLAACLFLLVGPGPGAGIVSAPAKTPARLGSSVSKAPARTRFSICMRLIWRGSTRDAKSVTSVNAASARVAVTDSMALKPTFLTAARA